MTATALQSSDQSQTPTSSSVSNTTQAASQDQQNTDFPFITLAIGVPATTTALAFFFIGWWLLRKRLLPLKTAKLPPSGAKPWSRVRTSNTQWGMYSDGSTQPAGSNNQLFNGLASWGQNNAAPTGISSNTNIAPPNNTFVPTALPDYPEGPPDLNDPFLQQVIKQYSDKSRAAQQQKLLDIDDTQVNQFQNNDTWLQ